MKIENIGDAVLVCADFADYIDSVKGDHLITDPPYDAEAHTLQRRVMGKGISKCRELKNQPLPFAAMRPEQRDRLCSWAAVDCHGWLLAFCQAEAIGTWRQSMEDAGIKWRRAGAWIKPDSSPQLSGDRPAVGHEAIAMGWCGKGRSVWNGGGSRAVWTHGKHDSGSGHGGAPKEHPTQKPIALMDQLVNLFTMPGECVVDPFMGSGSTGVSCARLGRRFIGIEFDPQFFDIACTRIEAAQSQERLFA